MNNFKIYKNFKKKDPHKNYELKKQIAIGSAIIITFVSSCIISNKENREYYDHVETSDTENTYSTGETTPIIETSTIEFETSSNHTDSLIPIKTSISKQQSSTEPQQEPDFATETVTAQTPSAVTDETVSHQTSSELNTVISSTNLTTTSILPQTNEITKPVTVETTTRYSETVPTTTKAVTTTTPTTITTPVTTKKPEEVIKELNEDNINDLEVFDYYCALFQKNCYSETYISNKYMYEGKKYDLVNDEKAYRFTFAMLNIEYLNGKTLAYALKDCSVDDIQRYPYACMVLFGCTASNQYTSNWKTYMIDKQLARFVTSAESVMQKSVKEKTIVYGKKFFDDYFYNFIGEYTYGSTNPFNDCIVAYIETGIQHKLNEGFEQVRTWQCIDDLTEYIVEMYNNINAKIYTR